MTILQAFEHLLKNWESHQKEFRDKYRSYRSKYLKSLEDKDAEKIGRWKIVEMLVESGYAEIKIKVKK